MPRLSRSCKVEIFKKKEKENGSLQFSFGGEVGLLGMLSEWVFLSKNFCT